jgi:pimeloyl-ACP methyl ester carboxylesterase
MAIAHVLPNKSTTGRSNLSASARWRQLQIAAAASVTEELGGCTAARIFSTPHRHAQPDSEHSLLALARAFRVGGLAAWRWGTGPYVVLMHDWEGRGAERGTFVEPLLAAGLSVVTFDAPAHGVSPGARATMSDFADALTSIVDRFGAPEAIIAHSFGALGALLAVRRGVETKAMVLIGAPSLKEQARRFQSSLDLPEGVMDRMRHSLERSVGSAWTEVEAPQLARGIYVSGLIVHDEGDRAASPCTSAELARVWPDAELVMTEGLGHRRILRDPTVVDRVTEFVTRHARH